MQSKVLEEIDSENLKAYAVWEPILRTDNEISSRKATTLLPDPRVEHYWVGSQAIGEMFQEPINLKTEPAWDVYLVYAAGVEWNQETPPEPVYFQHQLGGRLPGQYRLNGVKLAKKIEEALAQ